MGCSRDRRAAVSARVATGSVFCCSRLTRLFSRSHPARTGVVAVSRSARICAYAGGSPHVAAVTTMGHGAPGRSPDFSGHICDRFVQHIQRCADALRRAQRAKVPRTSTVVARVVRLTEVTVATAVVCASSYGAISARVRFLSPAYFRRRVLHLARFVHQGRGVVNALRTSTCLAKC